MNCILPRAALGGGYFWGLSSKWLEVTRASERPPFLRGLKLTRGSNSRCESTTELEATVGQNSHAKCFLFTGYRVTREGGSTPVAGRESGRAPTAVALVHAIYFLLGFRLVLFYFSAKKKCEMISAEAPSCLTLSNGKRCKNFRNA